MSTAVPSEFQKQKGSTYETSFLYTGFSRYDTHKKTLTRITVQPDGVWVMLENPCETTVFSRGYHTELVRVTVYSVTPRIWKEELSPHEVYFFREY